VGGVVFPWGNAGGDVLLTRMPPGVLARYRRGPNHLTAGFPNPAGKSKLPIVRCLRLDLSGRVRHNVA